MDWQVVVDKLHRLKAIDRQCQAFGAETHRYHLHPRLSSGAIEPVERRLGVTLPTELRSFYIDFGDGIAGPDYGIKRCAELTGYKPAKDYPGLEAIKQIAAKDGVAPDASGYFEVPHEALAGLLTIVDQGCGHEMCLIASGPKSGNVVYVSCDGHVVETETTLVQKYIDWLDQEIQQFDFVLSMMRSGASLQEIRNEQFAQFRSYDAGDRIASIADVPKPVALFGGGNERIYHGVTQNPWYENVLKEWQRRSA